MPGVFSDFPISIDAEGSIKPWLLCMVRACASLRDNCCLSWIPSGNGAETVTGHIGTHDGNVLLMDGPLVIKLDNNCNRQVWWLMIDLIDDISDCTCSSITETNTWPQIHSQHHLSTLC